MNISNINNFINVKNDVFLQIGLSLEKLDK